MASVFVFGTCIVSTPSFDSALMAAASIASGSAKLREKLPKELVFERELLISRL